MKKFYFVYKITNSINGKIYIGKHETNSIDDNYFGSGKILRLAIKKYGRDNFVKEIIEYCNDPEDLSNKEIYWIKEINSLYPVGYNINPGGSGGDNYTFNPNKELIREKIKNRTSRKQSEDEKQYRRELMTGKKLKPHDKIICEFCDKEISRANYNRWHGNNCKQSSNYIKKELKKVTCEHCDKVLTPNLYSQYHGLYCKENPDRVIKDFSYKRNSEESIKKGVETRRQNDNYKPSEESNKKRSEKLKGTKKSDETKDKMSLSNKKKWERLKLKGELFICEHCGKTSTVKTNYLRWHGENCKLITNN